MKKTVNPVRLLAEILVVLGVAQCVVVLSSPLRGSGPAGLAAGLADALLLLLLAIPGLYWRCLAWLRRARQQSATGGTARRVDVQQFGVGAAIILTAVTQLFGVTVTLVVVLWLKHGLEQDTRNQFDRGVERIEAEVLRRFKQPLMGLQGARGSYAANVQLRRRDFQAYVNSRNLAQDFAGVRGFGFVAHVPRQRLGDYIAAQRADDAPDFAVHSQGNAADLFIVQTIEPLADNRAAWGMDIGQDPVRREAVERAVHTGQAALTAKVLLPQGAQHQAGFLYFLPVYRPLASLASQAERERALVGLLYAPLVAGEFFRGLAEAADVVLQVQLFDGTGLEAAHQLFDSAAGATPADLDRADAALNLSALRDLRVGGRTLQLRVRSTAQFAAAQDRSSLTYASLAGALVSALMALTVWLLAAGRLRAQRLAERMTTDLDRLARVVQHTSNAVTIADAQMRITWVNQGFCRQTGYTQEEVLGKTPGQVLGSGKTAPEVLEQLANAVAQGQPCRVEVLNRAKDAREYWVDTELQPMRDSNGVLTGFMEIGTDVTRQKQDQRDLEAALRASGALINTVQQHTIVSVADAAGTIIEVNDAFCAISGYTRAELIGHDHRIVNSGLQSQDFWAGMWATISSGAPWRGEICNRARDGSLYWVDSMIAPFLGPDGRVEKYVSMRTDITARKRDQQTLADMTDRLTLAIEGGSDGLWDWMDVTTDEQWWSPNYYALLGYTALELPARSSSFAALLHPDSVALSANAGHAALQGHSGFDIEVQLKTGHLGYRWFRIRGKVHFDAQGQARRMSGATQDIHERKLAQDALTESEAFLDRAGQIAGVGGWSVTLKTGQVHWSRQTRRIHEVDPDYQPRLDAAIDFYAPQARPLIENAVRAGMECGTPWDLELPLVTAKGRSVWVRAVGTVELEDGKPVRLVGAFQDITERRARDQELHLLESCIARIKDSIVITAAHPLDEPGPQIVFVNRAFEQLTGYTQLEALAHNPRVLQGPATEPEALRRIHQALERGQAVSEELLNYRKDGSAYWIEVGISPVLSELGEVTHFVAVERDITQRRQNDAALREALAHAEQASISKSQFVANMSHEIRTPMNAILGMLKLLQSTDLTQRQLDYVDKTEGAARSLLGLLNDILDFSKVEAGKMTLDPRPFRLERLMRELSVILTATLGTKEIEVVFDVDPAVPQCLVGDDMRLQQILINLASNAIKFTRSGEVVLRVRLVERSGNTARLEFALQDSGIGIAPQNQAHIFSGFSQAEASTTRRFGGTGLGLAISSRMVTLMGGTLALHSQLGQGSTFHFQLALELAAPEPNSECARMPLAGELRVLVVDDNALARTVLCQMAGSLGWAAEGAASGAEALERVQARAKATPTPYDAIFMDWQMPDQDGWDTSQRMRCVAGGAATPIVLMVTAHGREVLAQRSAQQHALINGFLVKPLTAAMMYEALADVRASADAAAQGRNPAAPVVAVQSKRLQGLRVLVVEDNKINQMVAKGLLEQEGASITLADDGQLGVAAVAQAQPEFDAVLMDVQMPVMDGYAATRAIRQELGRHTLPIIAMTANAMASDRAACLAAGMNDHVGKPFELDHLVATLLHHSAQPVPAAPVTPVPQPARAAALEPAGIDEAAALARFGGDATLLAKVLHAFAVELRQAPTALAQALQASDWPAAARTLHTLKGLAATAGAGALAAVAQELEQAVAATLAPAQQAQLLERLQAALDATAHALAPLLQRLDRDAALPALPAQGSTNPQAGLDADLQILCTLLSASDMQALAAHQHLQASHAAALGPALEGLDQAMAALDFARALQHCQALLQSLP